MEERYTNPRYGPAKSHMIAGWNQYVKMNEIARTLTSDASDRLFNDMMILFESMYDDSSEVGNTWKNDLKQYRGDRMKIEEFARDLLLTELDHSVFGKRKAALPQTAVESKKNDDCDKGTVDITTSLEDA